MSAVNRAKSANKMYDTRVTPAPDNQAGVGTPYAAMAPPAPAPPSPAVDTPTPFLTPDAQSNAASLCGSVDIRQNMITKVYLPPKAPPPSHAIISQPDASVVTAATPGVTTEVITGGVTTPPPPAAPPPRSLQPPPRLPPLIFPQEPIIHRMYRFRWS